MHKRHNIGDLVTLMVVAKITDYSDSHGLCYELAVPPMDRGSPPRTFWANPNEVILEPSKIDPTYIPWLINKCRLAWINLDLSEERFFQRGDGDTNSDEYKDFSGKYDEYKRVTRLLEELIKGPHSV